MSDVLTAEPLEDTVIYLMDTAVTALQEGGGGFVPFGAGARPSGDQLHFEVPAEEAQDAMGAIALLAAGIRKEHDAAPLSVAGVVFVGQIRVAGLGETPAICAHVEVPGGASLDILQPFARDAAGVYHYSAPIRRDTDPELFV